MPQNNKYWKRRFGEPDKLEPYPHHIDLRRIDDLDDEGFACLMTGIKGVDMLDLNETEITNESISLLTGLEYVKELRAKGCRIDDACAPDLNKIPGIEFLHLKNTGLTIDGMLQLNKLINLKTLMFSADDVDAIKQKLLQLKTMLPQCEFVIDSKTYYFDAVEFFIYAIKKQPYTYRLKIKNESLHAGWSNWLIQPSENYIEAAVQGTYSFDDIEWVEIDPVEKGSLGRLIPEKEIDHSTELIKLLEYLTLPFMVTGGIISVYLVKNEL